MNPILVNQKTAPEVLSFSSRRYLEIVRRKKVRHVRDGRLVIARVDDVLAALGLPSNKPAAPAPAAVATWSPESVLAGIRGER